MIGKLFLPAAILLVGLCFSAGCKETSPVAPDPGDYSPTPTPTVTSSATIDIFLVSQSPTVTLTPTISPTFTQTPI